MLERMKDVLRNRKEGDKGFSLVELAVVIVIIGILVAIAVPVFTSMQASAETATNKANAANGSSMIAAEVAASRDGHISKADAEAVLAKLKDDGSAVGASLTAPASGNVDLTNYCVQAGDQGKEGQAGPACAAPTP